MFEVCKRNPVQNEIGRVFEVLSVRVEDDKTLFLIFIDGDWVWEDSEKYKRPGK